MSFSLRQKRIAAFVVLALFLGSSLAIAIVDAFGRGGNREDFELPEKVSYEPIPQSTRNVLIGSGYMIVNYEYPSSCQSCDDSIRELITFVSDKPDAYLVITKNSAANDTVTMETYRGKKDTSLVTALDTYCELTYNTYDDCLIKRI